MCKTLLALAAATSAAGAAAAFPAPVPATASIEPEALARARVIRAEVDARYRLVPGRKLAVTEATTTGVVDSLTLLTDLFELRVVPADNGIYFAICSARAKCPYPARSASWPVAAFLPRRQALELALRTFLETSVSLVVVALPTAEPVWVVFERDDLLAKIVAPAVLDQLAPHPAAIDTPLRDLVDRLTRPRLFLPLPILPPPRDTIFAVSLFGPQNEENKRASIRRTIRGFEHAPVRSAAPLDLRRVAWATRLHLFAQVPPKADAPPSAGIRSAATGAAWTRCTAGWEGARGRSRT